MRRFHRRAPLARLLVAPRSLSRRTIAVADQRPQHNKALVRDAMTSLFQRRDAASVERLYAQEYVQHNPAIPQGCEALKELVATLSP